MMMKGKTEGPWVPESLFEAKQSHHLAIVFLVIFAIAA